MAKNSAAVGEVMNHLLGRLKRFYFEELNRLLESLFEHAEDWLFEQADAAFDASLQQEYMGMMRLIRTHRDSFVCEFSDYLDRQFQVLVKPQLGGERISRPILKDVSIDKLSLVGHDEMDQNVALDSMVTRARSDMDLTLKKLQARLGALLSGVQVTSDNNPFDPKALCEALGKAIQPMKWEVKHDLIFFKLFQRFVLSHYHHLLTDCDQLMSQAGILRDVKETDLLQAARLGKAHIHGSETKSSSTASDDKPGRQADLGVGNSQGDPLPPRDWNRLLSGALSSLRFPDALSSGHSVIGSSEPGAVSLELSQLMALFQKLQHLVAKPENPGFFSPTQLRNQLSRRLEEAGNDGEGACIGEIDSNIINLVSLLFHQVLENERLPQQVKAVLGRLQIPFIRIAVADPGFLASREHPARRLVNDLAKAGESLGHEDNDKSDSVFEKIQWVVKQVLDNYQDDLALIESLRKDFQAFVEKEEKRARLLAQRMAALEEGKSRAELAKQDASEALQQIVDGQPMPGCMAALFDQAWFSYLCWVHHREGKQSLAWNKAIYTAQQMLFCLEPVASKEEEESRKDVIAEVLASVKQGCKCIAYNEFHLKQWLVELENVFLLNAVFEEPEGCSEVASSNDQQADDSQDIALSGKLASLRAPRIPVDAVGNTNVTLLDISKKAPTPPKPSLPELPEDDPGMEKAKTLSVGTLLDFFDGNVTTRCKLAAHIKSVDKYIFVNRMGVKLFDKTLLEVAHDINAERFSILDDSQLFDKALESVINSLRGVRGQAV